MSKQTLIICGLIIICMGALSMLSMQSLGVRLVFGIPCAVIGGGWFFGGLVRQRR